MDLQTAAKRYEDVRHFWAREVAITLARGNSGNHRCLLRHLLASGRPMLWSTLTECWPSGARTERLRQQGTVKILRSLMRWGMVRRTGTQRAYWYALTELGELVLMYLPEDEARPAKKNAPAETEVAKKKKRGRPRKTLASAPGV